MTDVILNELQTVFSIRQNADESLKRYQLRLARKANDLSEDDWVSLKAVTQKWVNKALTAEEKGTDFPILGEKPTVENGGKAPVKAEAKSAKKQEAGGSGRAGSFDLAAKITVVSKENPKRAGSKAAGYWAKYKTGMSIESVLAAGVPWADIRWNEAQGFIKVK